MNFSSFSLKLLNNVYPCPCGYLGSKKKPCKCLPGQIIRYKRRLSGPILDRIDLHVDVPAVDVEKLTSENTVAESSASIRKRVQAARTVQLKRFKNRRKIKSNAEMRTKHVKKYCPLDQECLNILRQAVSTMNLSARAYYKTIKLARTIADLAQEEKIKPGFIAEALQYRPRDQSY